LPERNPEGSAQLHHLRDGLSPRTDVALINGLQPQDARPGFCETAPKCARSPQSGLRLLCEYQPVDDTISRAAITRRFREQSAHLAVTAKWSEL